MKVRKTSIKADICFICVIFLLFICIVFIAEDQTRLQLNCIILAVVLTMLIITYFLPFLVGLVFNFIFIIAYCGCIVVYSAISKEIVDFRDYFWIFWSPCINAAVMGFARSTLRAVKENKIMLEQLERLAGVDMLTELKNLNDFKDRCKAYIVIAEESELNLFLIIWQFRYQHELSLLIGPEGMDELVKKVSRGISDCLWKEDPLFLLDNAPYTWGTLIISKSDDVSVVARRANEKIKSIDFKSVSGKNFLEIEMRDGIARYGDQVKLPFQLLEQAKKNLQYDV